MDLKNRLCMPTPMILTASISVPWLLRNVSLSKSTSIAHECRWRSGPQHLKASLAIAALRQSREEDLANNVNHFTLGQPGAAPTRQAVISLKTAKVSGIALRDFPAGPR